MYNWYNYIHYYSVTCIYDYEVIHDTFGSLQKKIIAFNNMYFQCNLND